jgi:peptide-methionine (R)-S-oxide reductase
MGEKMFDTGTRRGISRRALLLMPAAFGTLWYAWGRRGASMPDARESGKGGIVEIVLFDDKGNEMGTEKMGQLEKSEAEWREQLGDRAYQVLREKGTERAFTGAYWDHKGDGVYRCAGCGTALFLSSAKFDSGTGWPSYSEPAAEENVAFEKDNSYFMERIEVHCKKCGGHLGHVFPDGPGPKGLRYCINSASLRFAGRDGD